MSIITTAAHQVFAQMAADNLAIEMKMKPRETAAWDIPDQKAWKAASLPQRCLWVGGWMRTAAATEAERMDSAVLVPAWIPGGDQYAGQND